MELTIQSPIRFVPHVGPIMAENLERLDIFTIRDLLYHIPHRYDDFSVVSKIAGINPGQTVTIHAKVNSFSAFATKTGKRMQQAVVQDETGKLTVIWFNQPYLRSVIKEGIDMRLSGSISWFGNKIIMSSPQYEIIQNTNGTSLHTGRLVPVYPETEGVSSKWLRTRIAFLLESLGDSLLDVLPERIKEKYHLMDLIDALKSVHFPETMSRIEMARHRLGFDELFMLQLIAYEQKRERIRSLASHAFTIHNEEVASLVHSLPFELTADQKTAVTDILQDLEKPTPMNRLLEGDVGSGKTVVAAIALYEAHCNGYQSAFMAPTQILAEQHYQTISKLLSPLDVKVCLVTGSQKLNSEFRSLNTEKTKISKNQNSEFSIQNSVFDVYIGTHALLSKDITFNRLGLVVVDEQQRFGVEQRAHLTQKNAEGKIPHLLTMTATPIPRTLAKTVFGSLDLSRLKQMPKGRQRVKTWVVSEQKRTAAYEWIAKELRETHAQAFIICPLIEESEHMSEVKAVKSEYERLTKIFKDFRLGLLHGKLAPKEKTSILEGFRDKTYDILVATPVVEVGIDIPNAAIMLIEAADRFGLGQLHQLRGRVGRGVLQSYCILFTQATSEKTISRLKSMETVYDGAELAEIDLQLRGPGDLFGSRQHGLAHLKVASYMDMSAVNESYTAVLDITNTDPNLTNLPLLREMIKKSKIESIVQD